jgi:catenin alpha
VASKSPEQRKGQSKKAHALVTAVGLATKNFVEKGKIIAEENPDIKQDMLNAVEEVRCSGEAMATSATEFANNPCSSGNRSSMVRASRGLLSAVTRLLILADMIDVHLLLRKLRRVEADLEYLKSVTSQAELMDGMERFGRSAAELLAQAAKRQAELRDAGQRDALAAARGVLRRHGVMLLAAGQVLVKHPELAGARENRDYVLSQVQEEATGHYIVAVQVCEAVGTMREVAQGGGPEGGGGGGHPEGGALAIGLRDLQVGLGGTGAQVRRRFTSDYLYVVCACLLYMHCTALHCTAL